MRYKEERTELYSDIYLMHEDLVQLRAEDSVEFTGVYTRAIDKADKTLTELSLEKEVFEHFVNTIGRTALMVYVSVLQGNRNEVGEVGKNPDLFEYVENVTEAKAAIDIIERRKKVTEIAVLKSNAVEKVQHAAGKAPEAEYYPSRTRDVYILPGGKKIRGIQARIVKLLNEESCSAYRLAEAVYGDTSVRSRNKITAHINGLVRHNGIIVKSIKSEESRFTLYSVQYSKS